MPGPSSSTVRDGGLAPTISVVQRLLQHGAVAAPAQRLAAAAVAEVDAIADRLRHAHANPLRDQFAQVQRFHRVRHGLCPAQRQQLGADPGGALVEPADVLQGFAHGVRVAMRQRLVNVQGHAGQRRTQLVGGIGDEAVLQGDHLGLAREQIVDGADQRLDLFRHVGIGARRQP
ncbi:hypothetical protein G6F24_015314 [Rhizopus arrhizus]|nr:hypothetical protein G6F24_015314 [Rhizopus arrhizus]